MNSDNIKLELILTPVEQVLAYECLEIYETIFGKKISLEELFKISVFHSLQINKCKKIILDSYEQETVTTIKKTVNKSVTTPRSKGKQQTLQGIAPIQRKTRELV